MAHNTSLTSDEKVSICQAQRLFGDTTCVMRRARRNVRISMAIWFILLYLQYGYLPYPFKPYNPDCVTSVFVVGLFGNYLIFWFGDAIWWQSSYERQATIVREHIREDPYIWPLLCAYDKDFAESIELFLNERIIH